MCRECCVELNLNSLSQLFRHPFIARQLSFVVLVVLVVSSERNRSASFPAPLVTGRESRRKSSNLPRVFQCGVCQVCFELVQWSSWTFETLASLSQETMSGFTPTKRNTSSSELLQTDHCEQGGSAHHLSASAASHNYNHSLQVDKSQPQLSGTPQPPSSAQLAFSVTNSPAKSGGHPQTDSSIIKPPDQFRTNTEDQSNMHGKFEAKGKQFSFENFLFSHVTCVCKDS